MYVDKLQNGKDSYFYEEAIKAHPIEPKLIGKVSEVPLEILNRANNKRENKSDGIGW